MAMTRVGAGLARRLVTATASPRSVKRSELVCLARSLRRASPGEAFGKSHRGFHSSRSVCSPTPPPPAPSPLSFLDMSIWDLSNYLRYNKYSPLIFGGTLCLITNVITFGVIAEDIVDKHIDRKLANRKLNDDEADAKHKKEREEYQGLEMKKIEEFDNSTLSSLSNLTNRISKFENKLKYVNGDDHLSRSDMADLPSTIINKLKNLESQVLELKTALAESATMKMDDVEIGEALSRIESKGR